MITNTLRVAAITAILSSASANAALEPRLGGKAYYDTETNLTWAAPVDARTISEQVAFVSNLVIEGVGGWRIPSFYREFSSLLINHFVCTDPDTCAPRVPLPPIDIYDFALGGNWVDLGPYIYPVTPVYDGAIVFDGIIYSGYETSSFVGHLPYVDFSTVLTTWPVHTGDVALVPEPATYAMLLAGMGLLGVVRIKWKL